MKTYKQLVESLPRSHPSGMTKALEDAYYLGYNHGWDGKTKSNPYITGERQHQHYQRGYDLGSSRNNKGKK